MDSGKLHKVLKEVLEEEKRDRCLRIADRKYDKPSAYKSGAVVRCRKGDIWKDLKEELNNNRNQDSIKQVFKYTPELSNIGTVEQYSQYLKTLFPNSKVKDIIYHRTRNAKFDKFNNKTANYIQNDTYTKDGIYFNNDINSGKEVYGSTVIPAIVNIKNPYSFKEEGIFAKEGDNPKKISLNSIDKKKLGNEDGILFRPGQLNGQTVVFEPEQIHILGSKQDIEGFKKHVGKGDIWKDLKESNLDNIHKTALTQTEKEALELVDKNWDKFGGEECNNGFCDIFAKNLAKHLPGSKIMSTEDSRSNTFGHVWIQYKGKYFDAETPKGVSSWKELPWMIKFYNNNGEYPADIQSLNEDESLHKWFSRKGAKGSTSGWVDCNAPDGKGGYKACGREKGEKRSKYPACRPTPSACKDKGKGKTWGKKSKK